MKNILDIHGTPSTPNSDFHPWLRRKLTNYNVDCPRLPNTKNPNVDEQCNFIYNRYKTKYDIILAHSLGGCVAMKLVPMLNYKVDRLILLSSFLDNNFCEGDEDIERLANCCDWNFNINKIKKNCNEIIIVRPIIDTSISMKQTINLSNRFNIPIKYINSNEDHACGKTEPEIVNIIIS